MSIILITGAATGVGNATARSLARAGHTVYATMGDVPGRNAASARTLIELARTERIDLSVVELDVTSQNSSNAAAATIIDEAGRIDAVVHTTGDLSAGHVRGLTDEDLVHLINLTALGAHRVNRAVLPHLCAQRSGTLLYVASTLPATTGLVRAPYAASQAAFDALAVATAREAAEFGIDTCIMVPGPATKDAPAFSDVYRPGRASGSGAPGARCAPDPAVAGDGGAPSDPVRSGVSVSAQSAADEIVRLVALPRGDRPFRTSAGVPQDPVGQDNARTRRDPGGPGQPDGYGTPSATRRTHTSPSRPAT
ncbi:SDR family NAD(P)-dependent oxidoreductase [Arthrobacter zhaoguopingii]|uniref:SDR family NAD(P)-dependent oxidoreductase n=1 Tax=Arthrobacter zhaoguopingii TaxID=2681491 RepID=UPI00135AA149|nr:SDR family NAD(P)-dependent oxidoreductase [Arthrobacter zhaoguopingii]